MFYICTTVLYEYLNSLKNDAYDLFVNMQVQIKIYWRFIYIANEGRYVRILCQFVEIFSMIIQGHNSKTGHDLYYQYFVSYLCLLWK